MGEKQFGARWWRESLGIARWATRPALGTMSLFGALSLGGCATWGATAMEPAEYAREDVDVKVDALALQREEGWDVGQPNAALAFAGSTAEDAAGSDGWRAAMVDLATTMAPSSPSLQPFYVPTLFQSLMGAPGQRLRAVMRPMHTPEMDADFARGVALRAQFAAVGWPKDTAIVVDAPGPRALAVAAALADHFAPVYTFANWPHPLGVVPAHQTIAAALWYRPMLAAADALRPADAPPVFVLDANRLAAYQDADKQFDNRYFVHLPSARELAALGIKHVLYVGADGNHELDDLNGAMVALCHDGVDVKMVALGDFVRPEDAPAIAEGEVDEGDDEAAMTAVEADPAWGFGFMFAMPWYLAPRYAYRGCWWDHRLFWGDYGWYPWPNGAVAGPVRGPLPVRGPVVVGPPAVHRPAPMPSRAAWTPTVRATIFSHQPAHFAVAPSFGQVAVRASRADGHVLAVQPGNAMFRGGSIGAFHAGSGSVWHGANLSGGGMSNGVFRPASAGAAHAVFGRSGSIGRAGAGGFGGG